MLLHNFLEFFGREYADQPFAEYQGQTLSYGEADAWANRFANSLLASGLAKGDRFAWLSKNNLEICLMFFGASKVGIIPVPLNYRLAPREWAYIVSDAESLMLFCEDEYASGIDSVKSEIPSVKRWVTLGSDSKPEGWQTLSDWLEEDATKPAASVCESDQCYQMYTSGTTGLPKGAMISQGNVTNNIQMAHLASSITPRQERNLIVAPVFHAAAALSMMAMVASGSTLVIHHEFVPARVVQSLDEEAITMTTMVPAMIQACLVAVPDIATRKFEKLRLISYGASPIAQETLQKAMSVFGCGFAQGFGMTELTCIATNMTPAVHERAASGESGLLLSAGRPQMGTEIKIADENDEELPRGQVGQILVRGPQTMMGYWRLPEATDSALKGGWMHTGDAGYMDEEGFIYIQDRIKDMIVSGAENIYPAEVERAIFEHPAVADTAVVGIPDEQWGETVLAFVALKPGQTLELETLQAFCRERLAGYKIPSKLEIIDAIPRNASGKSLKTKLRQPYWEGKQRQVS